VESVRAVFAGLTTWDVIQLVERVPAPDEKVAGLDFLTAAGGPVTNAAVAFAHCGGSPTLVTALPEHPLSFLIGEDLLAHGVRLVPAATYPGAPITASISVTQSTGERAVVSPYAAAQGEDLSPVPADPALLDGDDSNPAGAVLIDGYFRHVSLPIAAAARERRIPVILDASSVKPYLPQVLEHVDLAVVSAAFSPGGDVFEFLAAHGVTRAVVTGGAGPVRWRTPAVQGEYAVPRVANVVDTLGAGDFFHGALTYRVAKLGLDDARLAEDIAFASAVAGRSLGSFGTRAWLG